MKFYATEAQIGLSKDFWKKTEVQQPLASTYAQIVPMFLLTVSILYIYILENRVEGIRLISFVHLLLYFAGIKIISSFMKLSC